MKHETRHERKPELSAHAVAARLARLATIATLERVEQARQRLERERDASRTFESAVACRLAELRALFELTAHLHRCALPPRDRREP